MQSWFIAFVIAHMISLLAMGAIIFEYIRISRKYRHLITALDPNAGSALHIVTKRWGFAYATFTIALIIATSIILIFPFSD